MFYYIPAWLKWWNEDKKAEETAPNETELLPNPKE
jgi:hypothetical protein